MSDSAVKSVIAPLIRATESGNLRWETREDNEFIVPVGNSFANIYNEHGEVVLRLMNSDMAVVDWVSSSDETLRGSVTALYEAARRKALGIDVVVSDMLQHLGVAAEPSH